MARTRTALLLIDFQEWIVRDLVAEGGREAARAAVTAAERVRAGGDLVVHVQYLHSDGSDGGPGSAESRFLDDIDLRPGDPVVTKHGRSAFEQTDLDAVLAREAIGRIVLTGVVTEGGVEATAHSGLDRGYQVEVLLEAVAGATPDGHLGALGRMRDAGVDLISPEPRPVDRG